MLPVEVAAVSMEGMDTVELTEFLDETLMNKLEAFPRRPDHHQRRN